MRKLALLIILFSILSGINAQDLLSKKGEPYLPEPNDWALQLDATPFLNYFGNFFNSSTTAPRATFPDSLMTITGKMFLDDFTAYRGKLRIGFNAFGSRDIVPNVTSPGETVVNERKVNSMAIVVGAGLEKRRGITRLQGFYGGEGLVMYGYRNIKYNYGNSLESIGASATRVIETKSGKFLGIGVRGFVGVEYFILPKIALGAELGWGIGVLSQGGGTTTTESYNTFTKSTTTTTVDNDKESNISIDSSLNNPLLGQTGSLLATFHF